MCYVKRRRGKITLKMVKKISYFRIQNFAFQFECKIEKSSNEKYVN